MSGQGRPSLYTPELAASICARLAEGEALGTICADEGMPSAPTVRRWAAEDREGFSAEYARAREVGWHAMAESLLEITDDGRNDWMEKFNRDGQSVGWQVNGEAVMRSRLRFDARRWLLSKMLPKVYGDRVDVNHSGEVTATLVTRLEAAGNRVRGRE